MTPQQQRLATENVRLIHWWLKRYCPWVRRPQDREVYESVLMVALTNAATKFNPDRGFKFTTYVTRAFQNAVSRHRVLSERSGREFPFDGDMEPLKLTTDDHDATFTADEVRFLLANAPLSVRERVVVQSIYFEGRSRKDVAAQLGVTVERVRQTLSSALEQLRNTAHRKGVSQL